MEQPLIERFGRQTDALKHAGLALGAADMTEQEGSADLALRFVPLPKIPVLLLFWNAEPADDLEAQVKLLFDETITEHLDIESILFLSERLCQLLCEAAPARTVTFRNKN